MDQTHTPTSTDQTPDTYEIMSLLKKAKEERTCSREKKKGCGGCEYGSECAELGDIISILYGSGERLCI